MMAAPKSVKLHVAQITQLGPNIVRVGLHAGRETLPRYQAGQYLKLVMPDGSLKPLSIASAPESDVIELQVQSTANTDALLSIVGHFRQNEIVECLMPFGQCQLPSNQRPVIMIAGGTGIAQMRSLLASSIARNEERQIWIYWGVASEAGLFLDFELASRAACYSRVHYCPVVELPANGWSGLVGLPHRQAIADHPSLEAFDIFCSGSLPMAKTVYRELLAAGITSNRFYCDWFDILRERNEQICEADA